MIIGIQWDRLDNIYLMKRNNRKVIMIKKVNIVIKCPKIQKNNMKNMKT